MSKVELNYFQYVTTKHSWGTTPNLPPWGGKFTAIVVVVVVVFVAAAVVVAVVEVYRWTSCNKRIKWAKIIWRSLEYSKIEKFFAGLFLDSVIEVAKKELRWECDYVREAECTRRFKELTKPYPELYVPEIIPELCTKQVFAKDNFNFVLHLHYCVCFANQVIWAGCVWKQTLVMKLNAMKSKCITERTKSSLL